MYEIYKYYLSISAFVLLNNFKNLKENRLYQIY